MCQLIKNVNKRTFTGYKVAIKSPRSGKYRSASMGFEYKLGDVPIPKKQRNLTGHFASDILIGSYFSNMMTGRTCVFARLEGASELYHSIMRCLKYTKSQKVVLLKMKISKNIMIGNYNDYVVYAGKKILSFKEIKYVGSTD